MAEAHDPPAPLDHVTDVGVGVLGPADGIEHVQGPTGRAAVERAGEGADCADHRCAQVGAGRGDDPGGEGRRVEPVVDRRDEVLLEGPGLGRIGHLSGEHVEIVGRVVELRVRLDRLLSLAEPVERHHERRDQRAQLHGLVFQLRGVEVHAGPEPERAPPPLLPEGEA